MAAMAANVPANEENALPEASKLELFRIILTENDIPGASLQNRKPENLQNGSLNVG